MFTPLQFAQLAAAAWAGPAAHITTSASITTLACGHSATYFSVHYSTGAPGSSGPSFTNPYTAQGCPFTAVQAALDAAATAGVLPVAAIVAGTAIVQRAAASFANAPAPQRPATCAATPATAPRRISSKPVKPVIVCAACGEGEDPFGECRCSYVAVPESHYFNV